MQTSNIWRILSWVAVGLVAIPAVWETIDGDYLKAAAAYCLVLLFLLVAIGGALEKSRWQKIASIFLILLWIGLFALRKTA